tara:strand:+ start:334 stop:522 length:189 start_codon:yes stop_codon:yes gene_type:complete
VTLPYTLRRKQLVSVREKNGHLTYHLVVPQEFGKAHDLEHNREVIVEYRDELRVIPTKEAEE